MNSIKSDGQVSETAIFTHEIHLLYFVNNSIYAIIGSHNISLLSQFN